MYSNDRCLVSRRTFAASAELRADFASGALHPGDLKPALIGAVNGLLEPVRVALAATAETKALAATVRKFKLGEKQEKK